MSFRSGVKQIRDSVVAAFYFVFAVLYFVVWMLLVGLAAGLNVLIYLLFYRRGWRVESVTEEDRFGVLLRKR